MDFLWHKISEEEKEGIRKQAKDIMDSFSEKLSNVNKETGEPFIERPECEREEGAVPQEIDRKIMFENAPEKNDNFIIAEKKSWK